MDETLEDAIKRGDKYFELYEQEVKCHNHTLEQYDRLADRLRVRDAENLRLSKMLIDLGVSIEVEDDCRN